MSDKLAASGYEPPTHSESVAARSELGNHLGHAAYPHLIVLAKSNGSITSQRSKRAVAGLARQLRASPNVARVETFLDGPSGHRLIARDGSSTLLLAYLPAGVRANEAGDKTAAIVDQLRSNQLELQFGGIGAGTDQVTKIARDDLTRAELLTLPILLILLLLVFRSVVAALLPLSIALMSLAGTYAGLSALSEVTSVSIYALNIATALAIGLSVDYSLLLVSRYRDELRTRTPDEALRVTVTTAGRTVLFSGLTVALTTSTLLIFPEQIIRSLGYGATFVSVLAVLASLLVIPPLLALLGERINALSVRPVREVRDASGRWYRFSYFVMRRAGSMALLSGVLLVVLGTPFLNVKFTGLETRILPESAQTRSVADAIRDDFGMNLDYAADVRVKATSTSAGHADLVSLRQRIQRVDGVASVSAAQRLGRNEYFLQVLPYRKATLPEAVGIVHKVRGLNRPGLDLTVAGFPAEFGDFRRDVGTHVPLAVGLMAAALFVMVFLMTGSLILPLKTLIMNLLTLSAAFGLLVFIFQHGRFESLLGYRSPGGIDVSLSVLIFAIVFAVSTDYGMFVLSRTKELHDSGLSNAESVAGAMQSTGRVVTAAALLLAVAMGALTTAQVISVKETGIAVAFAILLDATLVRGVLVPSLMHLLGDWNWWAPRWLQKIRFGLVRERSGVSL